MQIRLGCCCCGGGGVDILLTYEMCVVVKGDLVEMLNMIHTSCIRSVPCRCSLSLISSMLLMQIR